MLTEGIDFFDGKDVTLTRLLCFYCSVFRSFIAVLPPVGEPLTFTYQGETYLLKAKSVERAYTQDQAKLTTNEVFEVIETRRIIEKATEVRGDPEGALEFQMNLALVAALARKENEPLPVNPAERRRFVDGRALLFKGLPMSDVYRIRAFFLRTLTDLLTSMTMQLISAKPTPSRYSGRATGAHKDRQRNTLNRSRNRFTTR